MAIERTGTAVSINTANDTAGSQSITVPSDCTLLVVFMMGANDYDDAYDWSDGNTNLTLNSTSLTWRARSTPPGDFMAAAVFTMTNPPTGSRTFAWPAILGGDAAAAFGIVFYKGVDTSDPVIDARGVTNALSISGITTTTGSMTVFAGTAWALQVDASGNSQTVILNNITNGNTRADIGEKAEASSVSMTGENWSSMVAISLRAASATATIDQHSFRFFNDDGSESSSTPYAALNTNINLAANTTARIRFLIDVTGDPTSKQFQLEYRRKPSGGSFGSWEEVT